MYKKMMLVAIAAAVIALPGITQSAQPDAAKKTASPEVIARGKYMVQTGHCNNCHTRDYTKKEGQVPEAEWLLGSAPLGFRGGWGTTYASNLRLTVSKFQEEQWVKYVKVMRTRPPMPFWALRDTTDSDLAAMYQYIVSMGGAGQPAPEFVPADQTPKPPYETRSVVQ